MNIVYMYVPDARIFIVPLMPHNVDSISHFLVFK